MFEFDNDIKHKLPHDILGDNVTAFGTYSQYYNLLYKDKDYAAEVDYIDRLIRKFNPEGRTILDLGCGTGKHDVLLVQKGYAVTGVDQSEEMLAAARKDLVNLDLLPSDLIDFIQGDIREVRLEKTFDIVISLFHTISYQQTNKDLKLAFDTAFLHLKPGGIFIFDCWYGPGVLTDAPEVSVKEVENETISVKRIGKPVMYFDENIVDIHYHLFIKDKRTQNVEEIKERHHMRYLFRPEGEIYFELTGFQPAAFMSFLKDTPPPGKNGMERVLYRS